jgi:sugar diacid utilization regulator
MFVSMPHTPSRSSSALQRRYDRLRDVHEATSSLIALHNVDAVLKEITNRGRRLLSCDSVYLDLPLPEEPAVFAIRTWSGDLTPGSRGTTVTRGAGVGGVVLETGEPFQVENYLNDEDIHHQTAHDTMLAGNDIATLLCVPLVMGGVTTGLLFAARRRAARFDDDDVLILTALATHAAIAVHNAEVDEQREAVLERLSEAVTESERQRNILTRSASVHATLSDLVLEGATVREILEAIRASLGFPVAFLDRTTMQWVHGTESDPSLMSIATGEIMTSDSPSPHVRTVSAAGTEWVIVDAVTSEGVLGTLAAEKTSLVDDDMAAVLERAVQSLALSQLSSRALAAADRRSATELVTKLIEPHQYFSDQLIRRANRHGIDRRGAVTVVSSIDSPLAAQAATEWTRHFNGLFASLDDCLVVLAPAETKADSVRNLASSILASADENVSGNIIIGTPAQGIERTAADYSSARRALQFTAALGYRGTIHSADEWGVFSTLFHDPDSGDLDRFIEENVGKVLTYDARHDTSLARTAQALLEHNLSPKAAAVQLRVHANTVNQRAARLDRLLGESWRQHPRAFVLLAALTLHALRKQSR